MILDVGCLSVITLLLVLLRFVTLDLMFVLLFGCVLICCAFCAFCVLLVVGYYNCISSYYVCFCLILVFTLMLITLIV